MKPPDKTTLALAAVLLVSLGGIVYFHGVNSRTGAGPAPEAAPLENIALSPESVATEMQVRPEIKEALGLTGAAPGGRRNDLLRSLGSDLSLDECEALLRELLNRRSATVPAGWYSEYFHEIASVLQEQKDVADEFVRALATVARENQRDEVIRDYAIQHLRQAWERSEPEVKPAIESTFREFAKSGDPVVAGPSLLSLHLLGTPENRRSIARQGASAIIAGEDRDSRARFGDDAIVPLVAEILSRPATSDATVERLAAIRIAGDRRLGNRREDLRRIAADSGNEHAVVRMAAIAGVARFGDVSDKPFLESLDGEDPRIAGAVKHALASLP